MKKNITKEDGNIIQVHSTSILLSICVSDILLYMRVCFIFYYPLYCMNNKLNKSIFHKRMQEYCCETSGSSEYKNIHWIAIRKKYVLCATR